MSMIPFANTVNLVPTFVFTDGQKKGNLALSKLPQNPTLKQLAMNRLDLMLAQYASSD